MPPIDIRSYVQPPGIDATQSLWPSAEASATSSFIPLTSSNAPSSPFGGCTEIGNVRDTNCLLSEIIPPRSDTQPDSKIRINIERDTDATDAEGSSVSTFPDEQAYTKKQEHLIEGPSALVPGCEHAIRAMWDDPDGDAPSEETEIPGGNSNATTGEEQPSKSNIYAGAGVGGGLALLIVGTIVYCRKCVPPEERSELCGKCWNGSMKACGNCLDGLGSL